MSSISSRTICFFSFKFLACMTHYLFSLIKEAKTNGFHMLLFLVWINGIIYISHCLPHKLLYKMIILLLTSPSADRKLDNCLFVYIDTHTHTYLCCCMSVWKVIIRSLDNFCRHISSGKLWRKTCYQQEITIKW